MRQRILLGIFFLALSVLSINAVSSNPAVYASASGDQACNSLNVINSGQGCGNGTSNTSGKTTVNSMIKKVINTLSLVVGIITVFMIILAGFQFVTSGGDSNAVGKARTALLYSIVGLLIVALSQFLVHFVLNNVGA